MIKSLLDADSDEAGHGSAGVTSASANGSFLDLRTHENPSQSFDPFAITDRQPPTVPAVSIDEHVTDIETQKSKFRIDHTPEYFAPSAAETVRMTGLAWSAGIMFFGSVGLMMVFGWLVDTVLGSSPWGIVGGIVLGSVIGFVQLVRINTQLLKTTSSAPRSLLEQAAAENDKNRDSDAPPAIEPAPEISTPVTHEDDESTRTL